MLLMLHEKHTTEMDVQIYNENWATPFGSWFNRLENI